MCGTEPGNLIVGKARGQVKTETPVFHYMFVILECSAFLSGCLSLSHSHITVYAKMD